jgi:HEAT repeats
MNERARVAQGVAHPVSEGTSDARAREALPRSRASCIVLPRMHRLPPALVLLPSALVIVLVLSSHAARADSRTSYLIDQLKNDDYRVRTQAALALGASGDDGAVTPLCNALSDSDVSVKVAAAAALGKLGKPAGLPCLQSAERRESTTSVKSQIQKSITALKNAGGSGAGGPPAPPPPGPDAKVYVAIQVTNKTGRTATEVDALVRSAMQDKILAKKGYAVAPKSETTSQGGQVVKSKKLKGYFLIATVDPPAYAGGNLSQVVHVSMFTYPDKSLQGEFSPKLTQQGTSPGDTQSENILMKMCVENAVETFQKVVASML